MNNHLILKNRIKEIRKEKGLTQSELSKISGTTQSTISSLESWQYSPTLFTALLIVKAFDCKIEDCFYLEEIYKGE